MANKEQFSDRWGIIFASLGMAIGAGNLWRFPRLAGQYGGNFILLWILFLFIWSIPLLLAEFSIGKKYKRGVIGSLGSLVGERLTWMGFFVTVCTLGIAFYYSVVTAWSIEYLFISGKTLFQSVFQDYALSEELVTNPDLLRDQWASFSNGSYATMLICVSVVLVGVFVVSKGIKGGLERANRLLIPSLFVLLIIVASAALSMEGGVKGLEYMFAINVDNFWNATIWIEALSQSAWSTGAGWGLMITISSYSRNKEDVTLNTFIGAFGNNSASILAGMAILPAVFAMSKSDAEAISFLQSGSQALTFTIIPELFSTVTGGALMTFVFFLALTLAAFSSFLPMLELLKSNLVTMDLNQKSILVILTVAFILLGLPSAYSLNYFNNQDWVWGLGLIVSGIFICIATAVYGPKRFKSELIDVDSDFKVPDWFFSGTIYINSILGIVLIGWWMSQGYSDYPWFTETGSWNWLDTYSNASIVTQWITVILLGLVLNKYLYRKFCKS